jgi:hypothetical protein
MGLLMSQASGQVLPASSPPTQTSDVAASRAAASAMSTPADGSRGAGSPEAEAFVRRLIKDPRILLRPWARIHQVFPAGCQRVLDEWDLSCPPMPGVVKISAFGNARDVISVVFKPPVTCERLHAMIRLRYGAPAYVERDDPCGGYWDLKRWHVPGVLELSRRLYDNGEVHLQMGVEQGP